MDNQTVVINLFGGPGAGKSTCAMEICSELKKHGLSAEYVQEYAKELVYENRMDLLDGSREHQQLLFEEQKRRMNILLGKVDFIVTDSPVILSAIYNKDLTPDFEQQVLKEFNKNRNFNIFINRGKTFESNGRIHNLDESIEIDNQLKEYLEQNQIYYGEYQHDTISKAVNNIQDYVTEQKINSISNQRNKKEEIDGGVVRMFMDGRKKVDEKTKNDQVTDGTLYCAGMIAGEGIVRYRTCYSTSAGIHLDVSGVVNFGNMGGVVIMILMILTLLKFSFRKEKSLMRKQNKKSKKQNIDINYLDLI